MPEYEFAAKDGSTVTRFYAMQDAPPIGKAIRVAGVQYRRVPAVTQRGICRDERHVAHTLPRKNKWKGAPDQPADHLGRFLFTGKQDRVEFQAKLKDTPGVGAEYVYD